MTKVVRIVTGLAIALGGFVTLVGVMGAVGLVTENVWGRLALGVLVVVALPASVADRFLKRANATLATRGSLGTVANVFAIVLLGAALTLVSANGLTKALFAGEGDRYARSGSPLLARAAYFVGSESPVFSTATSTRPSASMASGGARNAAAPSAGASGSASGFNSASPSPSP